MGGGDAAPIVPRDGQHAASMITAAQIADDEKLAQYSIVRHVIVVIFSPCLRRQGCRGNPMFHVVAVIYLRREPNMFHGPVEAQMQPHANTRSWILNFEVKDIERHEIALIFDEFELKTFSEILRCGGDSLKIHGWRFSAMSFVRAASMRSACGRNITRRNAPCNDNVLNHRTLLHFCRFFLRSRVHCRKRSAHTHDLCLDRFLHVPVSRPA